MAAGLIRVKRQTVGRAVTALLKWDTSGRTFTHQFSQFTLQQSWREQKNERQRKMQRGEQCVGEVCSRIRELKFWHSVPVLTPIFKQLRHFLHQENRFLNRRMRHFLLLCVAAGFNHEITDSQLVRFGESLFFKHERHLKPSKKKKAFVLC